MYKYSLEDFINSNQNCSESSHGNYNTRKLIHKKAKNSNSTMEINVPNCDIGNLIRRLQQSGEFENYDERHYDITVWFWNKH